MLHFIFLGGEGVLVQMRTNGATDAGNPGRCGLHSHRGQDTAPGELVDPRAPPDHLLVLGQLEIFLPSHLAGSAVIFRGCRRWAETATRKSDWRLRHQKHGNGHVTNVNASEKSPCHKQPIVSFMFSTMFCKRLLERLQSSVR